MSEAPEPTNDPVSDWVASSEGQARVAAVAVPVDLVTQVATTLGAKAAAFLQIAWVIADPATGTFPLEPKVFAAKIGISGTSGLNSTMAKLADAGHVELIDKATGRIKR